MNSYDFNLGFIGGGNMSKAIGEVIVKKGLFKPSQIWVSGPHIENLDHWKTLGANVTTKNGEVVSECSVIFICVKPHLLDEAIAGVQGTLSPGKSAKDKLFVSILAGTSIKVLKQALSPFANARIVRAMPNTPMTLGVGATVFTPDKSATEKDCEIIEKILACAGIYQQVPETMINPVGGLAGSGPAFVYLMIEALSDGGVKQGLPRAMATKFAAQTVMGAAQMVLETGKHPGQLKDEVCSPGGSTICGIYELEKGGVRASYIRAVQAAVEKSTAMGKLNEP